MFFFCLGSLNQISVTFNIINHYSTHEIWVLNPNIFSKLFIPKIIENLNFAIWKKVCSNFVRANKPGIDRALSDPDFFCCTTMDEIEFQTETAIFRKGMIILSPTPR